jgi:glycosyltransferase involved in cell wall biosynthesis
MISIIIPVYNGKRHLEVCLTHIAASTYKDYEIIVVDDCSSDDSGQIAKKYTVHIIRLAQKNGPAAARNIGSQSAKGEILLFIDNDIFIMPDTIQRMAVFLNENKDMDGVTGIYAQQPFYPNFCSCYKHLYLRYKFINMPELISVPNTALLAVRKDAFKKTGGFNPALITGEDFEFGQRFSKAGFKVYNDQALEVAHARYFSFVNLIYDDFIKARNLAEVFLNQGGMDYRYPGETGTLSISGKQLAAVISTLLLLINLCLLPFLPYFIFIATGLILASATIIYNLDFWRFLWKRRGVLFKFQSFLFTYLEHLVSAAAIITAIIKRGAG